MPSEKRGAPETTSAAKYLRGQRRWQSVRQRPNDCINTKQAGQTKATRSLKHIQAQHIKGQLRRGKREMAAEVPQRAFRKDIDIRRRQQHW